jgi:hypothetical protein
MPTVRGSTPRVEGVHLWRSRTIARMTAVRSFMVAPHSARLRKALDSRVAFDTSPSAVLASFW